MRNSFYCQEFDTGSTLEDLPVYRVLSRIFCSGGGAVNPEKSFEPHGIKKKFFWPSRGIPGDMLPWKILKI